MPAAGQVSASLERTTTDPGLLRAAADLTEDQKFTADDNGLGQNFGYSVAVLGDQAVVGAPGTTVPGNHGPLIRAGAAYLFDLVGGEWVQAAKLTASDPEFYGELGISVALSEDRALVGAVDDDQQYLTGVVYVFDLSACIAECTETTKLIASDRRQTDRFGDAVAISGDYALVGADEHDSGTGRGSGAVYLYDLAACDAECTETAKLIASDASGFDYFGISVSLQGNLGLVGASLNNGSGTAYLFDLSACEETCTEMAQLSPSDMPLGGQFGISVSLSGTRALIGAPGSNQLVGTVYLFDLDTCGTGCTETAKLTATDAVVSDFYGRSVVLAENRALVGAHGHDAGGGAVSGAAYLYDLAACEAECTEAAKLTASDATEAALFGNALSLAGDRAVIGAPGFFREGAGTAYVFDLGFSTDTENQQGSGVPVSTVWPNPAVHSASVRVAVDRPQRVRVHLIDALGREIERREAEVADKTDLSLDLSRLGAGVYSVHVVGETFQVGRRLTVVR